MIYVDKRLQESWIGNIEMKRQESCIETGEKVKSMLQ